MADETNDDGKASSVDAAGAGRMRRWSGKVEDRFFDDRSPYLDRFGSLLGLTVVAVVALSLIDIGSIDSRLGRGVLTIVASTTTGVTLVLALRAAGVAPRGRRVAEIAVVLAFLASVGAILVEQFTDNELGAWQSDRPSPFWVTIAVVSPIAVVRRLIKHRTVSSRTLAGAIAAYLLIAIAYSYVFSYLDALLDDGFFGQGHDVASHEFIYFSLVTITTVGYGDLAPDAPISRLLATSEAVMGQVYLVTFVAMVVGLMIQQRDTPSS